MILLFIAAAAAAELSGEVRERGSGDPIPAVITVDGVSTAATGRGTFSLTLPDGEHELTVTASDYLSVTLQVRLPSAPIQVWMEMEIPEMEIVIEADRPSPHAARQILDRERVEQTPGTFGDPMRLLQSLPGVVATREYSPSAGEVVIRGSAPAESRIYFDGVEIPYLYHFQQYASVVHTRLLDEVAVYPSAFGASYGDATGGVVSVSTRDAETDRVHGEVSANLITAGAYLTAPVGEKGAVSVSGRRSYADLLESENDQYTLWPVFWDYLSRYDHTFSPDSRLSLTAIGSGDAYGRYAGDSAVLDPLEQEENPAFEFSRRFHGLILRHRYTSPVAGLTTSAALVDDLWQGALSSANQTRAERYAWLRHSAILFASEDYQLAAGFEGKMVWLDRQVDTDRAWAELGGEAPLLARGVSVNEQLTQLRTGMWLEPRIGIGPATIQPGGRLQWDSGTGTVTLDPRLTVQAALSGDWQLRGGAGRYSQPPELDALSPTAGDPSLPVARSEHITIGVDKTIASRWEVAVDAWGKQLHNVLVEEPGVAPTVEEGTAVGLELTSRYRLRERFFSWASLTLGRAERGGASFSFDQPYAVNLVASWEFAPRWDLGVRYRYAAGLPFTPIVGSTYDGTTDSYFPNLGESNSVRLANYQKVDFHLGHEIPLRRWTLSMYLEAWFVPPGANTLYPVYSYDYSEQALVVGPALVPLIGGRAEF
ncbi:MAG: hypothetical protein ACI8RZ_006987 [Myxococcota bacterium]